ncbi:MAG: calcium/sodium antiporter [Lysobacterales bacterium]
MSNFRGPRQDVENICYDADETIQWSETITLTLLIIGLFLLLAGGFGMVRGASGLAEGYGVPPLVVGMTVVAFGTSAPELVVNFLGALRGETAIAFGNITGSNLANIGLVLGAAAVTTPIALAGKIIRRELPLLLLATVVLLAMTLDQLLRSSTPVLDRSDAVVMLLLFGIFIYITVLDFLRQRQDPLLTTIDKLHLVSHLERKFNWIMVAAGIIGLAVGAQLTIDSGADLATELGVPTVIVGMLVVAVGTSLPELVTSIYAALKGNADLCVGNVIGSNIFNAMFVLPISALIHPLEVPAGGSIDIFASLILSIALIPVFIAGKTIMSRQIGAAFLLVYVSYMTARYYFS